ncbi:MAG: hypothetical protein ABJA83_05725 [Burkholderiaceae bacterium]
MRLILAIIACLVHSGVVHAADIERRCHSNAPTCIIAFTGEIDKGDAERLTQALLQPLPSGKSHVAWLEVDSLGGDVTEALRIGELVRQNMLGVSLLRSAAIDGPSRAATADPTPEERVCASACVLILMSAPARWVRHARIGLHRPRLSAEFYRQQSPASIARAHADLDRRVRETVIAGGMPTELIDRMMRYASNELLWLAGTDLAALDSEAPWYQEMQIAVCGASPRVERRSAVAVQAWAKHEVDEGAGNGAKASEGCGAMIAMREQAKFRAARSAESGARSVAGTARVTGSTSRAGSRAGASSN